MVYTSHFRALKEIQTHYPELNSSSIASSTPTWADVPILLTFQPPWELVSKYKNGSITSDEYTKQYLQQLNKLNHRTIIKNLDNTVLLCWCVPERFCHRHVLSSWLNSHNVSCQELVF